MWPGAAGSTTMLGSLFGNGSSQSSFVFAPPLVTTHSNCECGPCCLSNPAPAVAVRFPAMPASGLGSSPAPEPPASTAAHTVAATVRTDTLSIRILAPLFSALQQVPPARWLPERTPTLPDCRRTVHA